MPVGVVFFWSAAEIGHPLIRLGKRHLHPDDGDVNQLLMLRRGQVHLHANAAVAIETVFQRNQHVFQRRIAAVECHANRVFVRIQRPVRDDIHSRLFPCRIHMPQSGAKRAVIIRRGTVETPLRSFPRYNQRMERAVRTQGFVARQLRRFQIQRRAELLAADGQHIAILRHSHGSIRHSRH